MKVLLPSRGLLGQKSVDLKSSRISDIREVQEYSDDDFTQKCRFLQLISDINLSKVTYYDVQHLFILASYALMSNQVTYTVKCKHCGEEGTFVVGIGDQEIIQLGRTLPYFSKRINTVKYTYTIVSAQDILNDYDTAQYEDKETDTFTDLKVARIMGHPGELEFARKLPVSIYASALVFQDINFHGIVPLQKVICPKCGKEFKFRFSVSADVLKLDVDKIFSKYVMVSDFISFSDYMSLSIRGFNALVSSINKKLHG